MSTSWTATPPNHYRHKSWMSSAGRTGSSPERVKNLHTLTEALEYSQRIPLYYAYPTTDTPVVENRCCSCFNDVGAFICVNRYNPNANHREKNAVHHTPKPIPIILYNQTANWTTHTHVNEKHNPRRRNKKFPRSPIFPPVTIIIIIGKNVPSCCSDCLWLILCSVICTFFHCRITMHPMNLEGGGEISISIRVIQPNVFTHNDFVAMNRFY